jgi:hypothetical protein
LLAYALLGQMGAPAGWCLLAAGLFWSFPITPRPIFGPQPSA